MMENSQPLSLSSLPDEILENCLARISKWKYPLLSLVSKRFHSLLSSPQIFTTRSHVGTTEPCLYISVDSIDDDPSPKWYALWMKPDDEILTDKKIPSSLPHEYSLIPLHSSSPSLPVPHYSTVAVGSDIFVIGGVTAPSSSVRILDCRSHTWRDAPSMTVARQNAISVLLEEKIYVMGGWGTYHPGPGYWFEVFDVKTQTWSVLPSPLDDHEGFWGRIAVNAFQGKLYVEAYTEEYTYEPKGGTWEVLREVSYRMEDKCVIENVMYGCTYLGDFMWFDYEGRVWRFIKGLTNLCKGWESCNRRRKVLRIVNYGGKLVVVFMQWSDEDNKNNKEVEIRCAKIALEKRFEGEIWGKTEWLNTLLRVPRWYNRCLSCVAVVSI
ncbi:unnamed protein product [Microthlaspi erraticum]|uniref:F-box domain-containing protein n=1 Tax=Microthlaspi erraticum TaxID=1685480 RepID=A0A6D2J2E9_9BRAS|nr:unnamed protein product [Microthlaspi erraticum]